MKWALLVMCLVAVLFASSGCISKQDQLDLNNLTSEQREAIDKLLTEGDKPTVAQYIGPTTWLPAEGM